MRQILRPLRLLVALLALFAVPTAPAVAGPGAAPADGAGWIAAMAGAGNDLRDYTMTLVKQEWEGEGLGPEEKVAVKWARGDRYYFKKLVGSGKGREVLFVKGWNADRLKISLNTWPNIKLNLDPCGKLALEGMNRPVTESSLAYLIETVRKNTEIGARRGEATFADRGEESVNGRRCRRIEVQGPVHAGSEYTVQAGEDLLAVGRKLDVALSTLFHGNRKKGWKDCFSVQAGDRIYVPRYYASRIELWIDVASYLPIKALIYDDDGALFERFEHQDLRPNVGLSDQDFSPDNPAYNF